MQEGLSSFGSEEVDEADTRRWRKRIEQNAGAVKRMNSSYRREELSRGKKSFPAEEGEY
jgi:hypothetical protein